MPLISRGELLDSPVYPPQRERRRVTEMEKWWRYSEGNFETLGKGFTRRLSPNIFNFIMRFWEDQIINTDVEIMYEGDARIQEILDMTKPSLMDASRLVTGNLIRYGCGLFINRLMWIPQSVDPRYWYPVTQPWDESVILENIVAYPYSQQVYTEQVPDRLAVYEFRGGQCDFHIRKYSGNTIAEPIPNTAMEAPCGNPAVVPVYYGEQQIYGRSDFKDIETYVEELHRRESKVSVALDRHTNPHLAVPEGSLEVDARGRVTISKDGMVLPVPEGSSPPQYVTWKAEFQEQSKAIMRAEEKILQLNGIAPILVHRSTDGTQFPASGTALRRLAIPTTAKIKHIRSLLDEGIKQVLTGMFNFSGLAGQEVFTFDAQRLTITWPNPFQVSVDEDDTARDGKEKAEYKEEPEAEAQPTS